MTTKPADQKPFVSTQIRKNHDLAPVDNVETVVIAAGQAALSMAYHLTRRKHSVLVLEALPRVGDVWRRRYDSLRLYSPSQYDGLPGWDMPVPKWSFPTKDELADYLEQYAERFTLPVRTGVTVQRVERHEGVYVVMTDSGPIAADNVVVATGTWQVPKVPSFAGELDPGITQLHSSQYRNMAQLQPGPALVVGAAHSGADLALELSEAHQTTMAGPIRGELPFDFAGAAAHVALPLMWFAANRILTVKTPMGRKAREHVLHSGGPLLRVKRAHLVAADVEVIEDKVTGIQDGRPVLADGRVLDVRNVVWCTGFRHEMSWIDLPLTIDESTGLPAHDRGVTDQPGLYFVGLPFLSRFASTLVGGVGADADRIATHIVRQPVRLNPIVAVDEREPAVS
jgi:putative flavoprotein involved in K+ transport